ncbi:hypothetical protein, partial [Pseudomonas syringae]|uniref:hypothetical protein n=1 Tax=Pseudomonas syringae TaxID=317 RepID=UPI001F272F07
HFTGLKKHPRLPRFLNEYAARSAVFAPGISFLTRAFHTSQRSSHTRQATNYACRSPRPA